jgi:hypothetical protein
LRDIKPLVAALAGELWRTSGLHGIVDARKNDKPVMIVLLNGHPFGCT